MVKVFQHFNIVNNENLALFHELVNARQETLGDRPFASVEKLEENSRAVNGTLIRLIAQQLPNGASETEELRDAANHLGTAAGVATLLR